MMHYFMYSQEFIKEHKEINAKIGRDFKCGAVSVGPYMKKYCEIISENDLRAFCNKYPDADIVAKGERYKMSYTKTTAPFIGSGKE